MTSGGAAEGFGHVARCAEVVQAARAHGARVAVSFAGDDAARALLERGCGAPPVAIDPWGSRGIAPGEPAAVLVDTPRPVRRIVEEALRRGVPTVVLDRLDFLEEATLTVLPVAHGPRIRHPRLRQGPAWCILPREVLAAGPPADPAARDALLLTLGGADPGGQTAPLATWLAAELSRRAPALASLERHAIVPASRLGDAALQDALEEAGFRVHGPLSRPAFVGLAARCAVAVCGFGVATYELARLGVPALHRVHRSADAAAARRLEALGLGIYAGGAGERGPEPLARALERAGDPAWLRRAALSGRSLLAPADGARRLAALLLSHTLTPSTEEAPCRA